MYKQTTKIYEELSLNESVKTILSSINDVSCQITFHMDLADMKRFNEDFMDKISNDNIDKLDTIYPGVYYKVLCIDDRIITSILSGNIFMECNGYLYDISINKIISRSITDSLLEPSNVNGSRDGFVENVETNIALIQKRVKTNSLYVKKFNVGKRSNTTIAMLYIKDIASKDNVREIISRIEKINTDGIVSIKDLSFVFEKNSIFPLTAEVGAPDIATNNLLDGRIVLIIDQIPVVICLPVNLFYFINLKESNYGKPAITFYYRILTVVILFFSVYFLGIYASAVNYHSKNLSLVIISEIKSSLRGATLPLFLEFIFLNFLFDLLRMASSKSPNISLQNVIVTVGGLLIGQNAVNSGFISSFNLVVTAICYLSSYALTNNQRFISSLSILRLFVLLWGMLLGMFGVLLSIILSMTYLNNLNSLKTPYLSPVSPFIKDEFTRILFTKRIFREKKRDKSMDTFDNTRGSL